ILRPIQSLQAILPIVRHHHERWDGTGYPDRLIGRAIPLGARIVAVCDAYRAMTEDRPYRAALGEVEARKELKLGAGGQFDDECVNALLHAPDRRGSWPAGSRLRRRRSAGQRCGSARASTAWSSRGHERRLPAEARGVDTEAGSLRSLLNGSGTGQAHALSIEELRPSHPWFDEQGPRPGSIELLGSTGARLSRGAVLVRIATDPNRFRLVQGNAFEIAKAPRPLD